MELSALLHFVRRYKWLIGGAVVAAAILAAVLSTALSPTYSAQARLVVGPSLMADVSDYTQLLSAQAMARTYAEAATTNSMGERVIERLGLSDTPEELLKRVSTTTEADSALLGIEVEDSTPDGAARIANDIAQDLIASSASLQGRDPEVIALVQEQMAALRAQIGDIDTRIAQLQASETPTIAELTELDTLQDRAITSRQTLSDFITIDTSSVSLLDPAVPPTRASSPQIMLNVLVAMVLGLVLGLAAAAVLRTLDTTIRTGDDVRTVLGVPLLGAIGNISLARGRDKSYRLVMLTSTASPPAEAFRSIRTHLEYASRNRGPKTILVTSPSPHDGKSTVAANLALAFAQAGRRTILIDGNLRDPSVHEMFRLPGEPGLSTYLRSDPPWTANFLWNTEAPNLRVLASGPIPPSPADVLGTPRVGFLLSELSREADLVIIDSPPLHAVTDAALLATHVDATILVIGTGRTKRDAAIAAKAALQRVNAPLIGVVLDRRDRGGSAPEEPSGHRLSRRSVKPEAAAAELAQPVDPILPMAEPYLEPSRSSGSTSEERR